MKKLLCVLLTLILCAAVCSCSELSPKHYDTAMGEDRLIVHFIDAGQGDSTLLESGGEFVLIDGGEKEYGERVAGYINSRHAGSLKYVICTHPHSDHYGGLRNVIKAFETENFITVETDCETYSWKNLLKAVDKADINYIDAEPGDTYSFGEATFTILAPLSGGYEGYNDYSVVTKVSCGDISFLLTGDAETVSEAEMLDAGFDLKADVLKCGHHGSSSSTGTGFLMAVDPAFAVISCAKGNDYGHPHHETLEKLSTLGSVCLRTDELGCITAATDGAGLHFSSEHGDLSAYKSYTPGSFKTHPEALCYIGNKNSGYFHEPTCEGVSTMNPKNKVELATRREAIDGGYTPCPSCKP